MLAGRFHDLLNEELDDEFDDNQEQDFEQDHNDELNSQQVDHTVLDDSQQLETILEESESIISHNQNRFSSSAQERDNVQTRTVKGQIPHVIEIEAQYKTQNLTHNLKTFREQMVQNETKKKQLEQQFYKKLRDQTLYLMQIEKEKQIKQKLGKKIDVVVPILLPDRQVEVINIKPKQSKPREQCLSTLQKEQKEIAKLRQKIEELQDQIVSLKQQHNEDLEVISTLKFQVNNTSLNTAASNSSQVSKSSNKPNINAMQSELERLSNENIQLKKTLQEERESFKRQLSRTHKVHKQLNDIKNKPQPSDQTIDQIEQSHVIENYKRMTIELNQQIAELRLKVKQQSDILSQTQDLLIKKDKELASILSKTDPSKYLDQISKLQAEKEQKQQELLETKEEMMIDNQLRLLFPNYGDFVLQMMNAIVLLEANKFIVRTSHKVCNRIVKGLLVVTGWFRKLWNHLIYRLTKNPLHHPSNKELINLAVKKIRSSPTVLELNILKLEKQVTVLRDETLAQSKEISELKENHRNQIERNAKIEELHKFDKIQMANNIMQRILKIKAEGRDDPTIEEIPEIGVIEEYLSLIYKSTLPPVVSRTKSKSPQQQQQQQVKVEVQIIRPSSCTRQQRHIKRENLDTKSDVKTTKIKK